MTKYAARVTEVLRRRIHTVGEIHDGVVRPVADLPLPDRIEIALDGEPDDACMMYRYTDAGEFCGDTWHESLASAIAQAAFEYGLTEQDFSRVDE
jgi:hypothetical protein